MSVETTFNGPRTIRFEILIPTLRDSACLYRDAFQVNGHALLSFAILRAVRHPPSRVLQHEVAREFVQ